MKSICFIVPYFGKLPSNFQLWALSCKVNKTINWLIITDDENTPKPLYENVKFKYMSYQDLKEKIQQRYDFTVDFSRPWRLALMKPAYGEIFQEEIKNYDFWGYCDVDLMWGNIRKYYTDELMEHYDRIGRFGHSSIFRNTSEVNSRYRTIVPGKLSYIDIFSGKSDYSFDENGMDDIYDYLQIEYQYDKTTISSLSKYEKGFYLKRDTAENNKYQMFTWDKGRIYRYYLNNDGIHKEEQLYIHFWCRPMKYSVKNIDENMIYYIYPDVMTDKQIGISVHALKKYGTRSFIAFAINGLWVNRHKLTWKKIKRNISDYLNFKRL